MCVVKPFDVAEAFIEQHVRRVSLPELRKVFEKSLQDLGIRHFACLPHVDPLNPRNAGTVFQTYPADWVRYFTGGAGPGFGPGLSVPIHPPGGQMASCSVVPDSGVIDRGAYQAVFTMACFMFDAMLQRSVRAGCGEARAMQC